MKKRMLFYRTISLLAIFLMLHASAGNILAQTAPPAGAPEGLTVKESDDPRLAIRVFKFDRDTPLGLAPSRIVSVETGQAEDGKTNRRGCLDFGKVAIGNYSLSVNHEGKDYLLEGKIPVQDKQKVLACVALVDNNTLALITDKSCECKEFPFLWLVLGAGTIALIPDGDEDEEVSPSRP